MLARRFSKCGRVLSDGIGVSNEPLEILASISLMIRKRAPVLWVWQRDNGNILVDLTVSRILLWSRLETSKLLLSIVRSIGEWRERAVGKRSFLKVCSWLGLWEPKVWTTIFASLDPFIVCSSERNPQLEDSLSYELRCPGISTSILQGNRWCQVVVQGVDWKFNVNKTAGNELLGRACRRWNMALSIGYPELSEQTSEIARYESGHWTCAERSFDLSIIHP
jgi:hypothetical protein